jgi:predicted ATP-grasp superfamily ATP-dependent carboligase
MSAQRAGFSPWAADLFADQDLQAICPAIRVHPYPNGIKAALESAPSGPWMYTGALENHPYLIDRLAAIRPLYGISGESLRAVRDPLRLSAALRAAGYNSPRCSLSQDGLPTDGSWLVKPIASAGGNDICLWRGDIRCCGSQPENTAAGRRYYYYQERIEGLPASGIYVAVEGRAVFLGATRQLLGLSWCFGGEEPDNGFRYCGSVGPLACSPAQMKEFRAIGPALVNAFGLQGLFGVDMVLNGDAIWPIEINPRYTASVEILERLGGFSAVGWHVAACEGPNRQPVRAFSPTSAFRTWKTNDGAGRIAAKAELYAPRDIVINDEFLTWARRQNHEQAWPNVADISASGTAICRGHPIVTVFADGATEAIVMQRLMDRAAEAYSVLAVSAPSANNLAAGVSQNSWSHRQRPMVE